MDTFFYDMSEKFMELINGLDSMATYTIWLTVAVCLIGLWGQKVTVV